MTQRNHVRALLLAVVGVCAFGVAGCAEPTTTPTQPSGSMVDNTIDPVPLDKVMDAVAAQQLPVTGRHDATDQLCPSAGCTSAEAADQLTILHFPTTGRAEIYAGGDLSSFQILDVVVTFPDGTPEDQRTQYEAAVKLALR